MKFLSGKLQSIIKSHSEPIGVFNSNNVDIKIKYWNKNMQNIKPYYAIKSLNHPYLLRKFMNIGYNFDVASSGEIYKMMSLGCNTNRMILANPCSSYEDINIANKFGIKYIVCDNYETVKYIKSIKSNMKIIWRIQGHEDTSLIKFNAKFGASINETIKLISKPNNCIYGLSFHVGSGCNNMGSFSKTLSIIRDEILQKWYGECKLIDIGGGMKNIDDIINLGKIMNEYTKQTNIKWIAEPGRYFSEDSIDLYTKIINIKIINDHYHIYINDSIYNSFSGIIFDHQYHYPVEMYNSDTLVKATIWGCTCDGLDKIVDNIFVSRPIIGNILKWTNMGAYTMVSASNEFNGFKKAYIVNI